MARIEPIPTEQISVGLRALLGGGPSTNLGAFAVWARRPDIALAMAQLQRAVSDSSLLSPRLIEIVRLRIAFHNQCRSCMAVRNGGAVADGVSEDVVCELQSPDQSEHLTAQEKAALRYADLLATDHLAIDDATFADLRAHFTDEEIVELCFHAGYFVGFGRVASTWDLVDTLPPYFRERGPVAPWGSDEVIVR